MCIIFIVICDIRIGILMVSVLDSSTVDREFETGRVKPKAVKLVFVASSLSTLH